MSWRASNSIIGVTGVPFASRCATGHFTRLFVIELVLIIEGKSLQPLLRFDKHVTSMKRIVRDWFG